MAVYGARPTSDYLRSVMATSHFQAGPPKTAKDPSPLAAPVSGVRHYYGAAVAASAPLPHPLAVAVLTAGVTGATTFIGAWLSGGRTRYLRFWAPFRLLLARVLAFAGHAALGLVAWRLADTYDWVPAKDPSLWFLNAAAYAAAAEAAFRADWAGLWLEPAGSGFAAVRAFDKGLGALTRSRAQRALTRVVTGLATKDLVGQASRLLTDQFGQHPTTREGRELWGNLSDNLPVFDALGPLPNRTAAQEVELESALTAVRILVIDRIVDQRDVLGVPDRTLRQAAQACGVARPNRWWAHLPGAWP